jgi:hypothetical protein
VSLGERRTIPDRSDSERHESEAERVPKATAVPAVVANGVCVPVPALQRGAGNLASLRLMRSAGLLARYGTGEHAQLGGNRSVDVNGVKVSEGELIALGDFYESPEQVYEADPGELAKLVGLIRRDREALEGVPGQNRVTGDEWQAATTGPGRKAKSYLDLAKENDAHFGPSAVGPVPAGGTTPAPAPGVTPPSGSPPTAPQDHREAWRKMHGQALELAHAEAKGSKQVPPKATAFNGFAAHFLTDAFAAGHLLAKRDIMKKAKEFWDKQKTTGLFFKESDFTKNVARKVLGDPVCKQKLASKELKMVVWDDVSEERFSEFLWQMAGSAASEKEFFSAFAKVVHDELNASIGTGNGVEVQNGRGDTWELSGDDTLALSGKTKEVARAAVEESYKNLEHAAQTEGKLDTAAMFDRVWKYTPRPTKKGDEQIKKVLDKFADASSSEAQDRFAAMAISNIDLLIAQLKQKGYMRDKPAPKPPAVLPPGGIGGNTPAPVPGVMPPTRPPPPVPAR